MFTPSKAIFARFTTLGYGAGHHHGIGRQGEGREMVLGQRHPVEANLVSKLELVQRGVHRPFRRIVCVLRDRHRPASPLYGL